MSGKNMPGNRIIFLITTAFFKTYVIKSAAEKEIHTGSIASVDRSKKIFQTALCEFQKNSRVRTSTLSSLPDENLRYRWKRGSPEEAERAEHP